LGSPEPLNDTNTKRGRELIAVPELHNVCALLFFGEEWTGSIDVVPPPQPDSHNCSVYVLLNAWHWARALPLPAEYPPTESASGWPGVGCSSLRA
jgi:hypothetical protein